MCGIAGYVGKGDRETLKRMTDAIRYRGPDDEGFFVHENVGLGVRRLSIIDVAGGHQPIGTEDGHIQVVFNGEIYNFQELRRELEACGHRFATRSDTEVIAHGYEQWGTDCFAKLNGMFGLAIWDGRTSKLVLARDRMGKKPLYWTRQGSTLVFGSELKSVLQHPVVPRELDREAFSQCLTFEYVPTPKSIFKNISKLEPASFLVWDGQEVSVRSYWQLAFGRERVGSEAENRERLHELLKAAVERRLISDVPLGIFLSGGIDSSTVAYFAQHSGQRQKTFSIGFGDPSFDESSEARRVAKALGTEHHEKQFGVRELLDTLPQVAELLDEPFADPSILPTYLLSKFARERVTVALGGDGGDELFLGYPTFQAHTIAAWYLRLPKVVREYLIEPIIRLLPVSDRNISLDFKLKRFIRAVGQGTVQRDALWLGALSDAEKQTLLTPDFRAAARPEITYEQTRQYLDDVRDCKPLEQLAYVYLRTYLMDDILVKVDRASMMASLEVRAPFLDYTVVDFVNSLPVQQKLKGFQTKYLLKRLMRDKLPDGVADRPKKGFGIPVAKWLRQELRPLVRELLSPEALKQQGIFEPAEVSRLIDEHNRRAHDHRKALWTLLMFQLWWREWLEK
ncbi:asparagine synthase (glutamine-hydrolyzing) [Candidatus Parcubacteria bacterium]|nr:asparagine synthase (glutamine-hydrolyzing) [Candidatus Parcubacteria bacterium]